MFCFWLSVLKEVTVVLQTITDIEGHVLEELTVGLQNVAGEEGPVIGSQVVAEVEGPSPEITTTKINSFITREIIMKMEQLRRLYNKFT